MKKLIPFFLLLAYVYTTHAQQYADFSLDLTEKENYGEVSSLAESQTILQTVRNLVVYAPELLRETGKTFPIKLVCQKLEVTSNSNEKFFRGRELQDFKADVTATVYEFEYTGITSKTTGSSSGLTVSVQSNDWNQTATRVVDTTRATVTQITDAISGTGGTCLRELHGLVMSNNVVTGLEKEKLYVIVYSQVQLCGTLPVFFAPVIITTGSKKPQNISYGPHILYIPIYKPSNPSLEFDLEDYYMENIYGVEKAKEKVSSDIWAKTKYDHIDIGIVNGGAKDGDRVTIYLNDVVIAENISTEEVRSEIHIPLTPGINTLKVVATNTGTISECSFAIVNRTLKVTKAFRLNKGESATVLIEMQP